MKRTRRAYLGTIGIAGLAGCTDVLGGEPDGDDQDVAIDQSGSEDTADDPTPSVAVTDSDRDSTPPTSDQSLPLPDDTETLSNSIVSGGVSQDGIPSIDDPNFLDANAADEWLDAGEPVFGIAIGDDVRAYPQRVLVWHEIVNDVIDGESLAITYCPLTGTAQAFERGSTEFGVSGRLLNSNLVMYDRETESYWPQMLATAIRGEHEGTVLREIPLTWTTWNRWKSNYPETTVLSDDTAYVRDYDRDPYGSYNPRSGFYADDSLLFSPYSDVDDSTFHIKDIVLGARSEDGAVAVSKESLLTDGLLQGTVGDIPYIAVANPTLATGYFYRNPDDVAIEYDDGEVIVDGDSSDPWDLPLERVLRYDAFWFAWAGYYPETEVMA